MTGAQIAIGMAAAGEAGGMPISGKAVDGEASSADALFFEHVLAFTAGGFPKHWDLEIERPIDVDTADQPPVAPLAVPAAFVPVPQEWWPPSLNSEAIALPPTGCAESLAATAVTENIAAATLTRAAPAVPCRRP